MGLTRRVADLRGRFLRSSTWKEFRRGVTTPLGLGAVLALAAAVICGITGVDVGVREATIGELFVYLGWVLLVLSMARETGVSRLGLAVLSVGGVGVVSHRLFATEWYSWQLTVYFWVFHLLRSNANGLSKEEFDRRYYSPPGPLSFSELKAHLPAARSEEVRPPEPDV